jgi:hypothetical protein
MDNLAYTANGQAMFVSFRETAWHRLGMVVQESMTATQGWDLTGRPQVEKVPLLYPSGRASGWQAIVRTDLAPQQYIEYGVVTRQYTLISPLEFCQAFDRASHEQPIETMGLLNSGVLFVTTRLPDVEIANDEYQRYVVALDDMTGNGANKVLVAPVRVVCQNTMQVALRKAEATWRVAHDNKAIQQLEVWLTQALQSAEQKAELVSQTLTLFAQRRLSPTEEETAMGIAVPLPTQPENRGGLFDLVRQEAYESSCVLVRDRRETISHMYHGAMTGYTPACHGTAYGFYGATVEAYEHVFPARGERDQAQAFATGSRRARLDATFNYLQTL